MLHQPRRHEYHVRSVTYSAFVVHIHAHAVPRAINLPVDYYF